MRKILLLQLSALFSITGSAMAGDVLTAKFSDDLKHVNVSYCFAGKAPKRLYRHASAGAYSSKISHAGKVLKVTQSRGSVSLPALPENACVNWQTNLRSALTKNDYRLILRTGNDLVMNARLWFWQGSRRNDLEVEIDLPKDMSISTPWMTLDDSNRLWRFKPDHTPERWDTRIAVGHFNIETINVAGASVRLAVIGSLSNVQKEKLSSWIRETAQSITAVHGDFPQPEPQILVIPIGKRHEAVVRGHVIRGGGLAAEFFVDETRPFIEFISDWTATHELSHMLIPYVSRRDRWLSEGIASYYQNVLRARTGRLTEERAWQNLYEGFQRGEKSTHGDSLAQATRSGRRSTMRIYWSGAAMMLKADMQLRTDSDGKQSLGTALRSLSQCCMENGKTWRARELFSRLDELTGTIIFSTLYKHHVNEHQFPDMQPTWQSLGIVTRRDRVKLSEDPAKAELRSSIMKG